MIDKIARATKLPSIEDFIETYGKGTLGHRVTKYGAALTLLFPLSVAGLIYEGILYLPKLLLSFTERKVEPISLSDLIMRAGGVALGAITFLPAACITLIAMAIIKPMQPTAQYERLNRL